MTRREAEVVAMVMLKDAKTKARYKYYNCQEYGHFAWECPKKDKEEKALFAQG
uniref:CCHC-type domain-containing protein n=1 Tax=Arundo donax TaxID=35708 RepID=A0A0A9GRL7_ARUDO